MGKGLENRCFDLLLSMKFAKSRYQNKPKHDEATLNDKPGRVLLEVEQEAHFYKDLQAEHRLAVAASTQDDLNKAVENLFSQQLEDIDDLYEHVLECPDALPAALDILQVKAASIGRLHPLIADMNWVSKSILHLVNLPQYRNPTQLDLDVKVTNIRLAMSYLGIENLKVVLPATAFRKLLPKNTAAFTLLSRKLWEVSLSTALTAQSLARQHNLDSYSAFCAGLYYYVGHSAIISSYLSLFSKEKLRRLDELRRADKSKEYLVLYDLEPEEGILSDILQKHGVGLSAKLVEKMQLKRLMMHTPILELSQADMVLSEPSALIRKAVVYSQAKMLERHSLITSTEMKAWLQSVKLTKNELEVLSKVRLNRLNLSFDR